MSNRRAIYKNKTAGFGNLEEKRILRALRETENRRHQRSWIHDSHRGITEQVTSVASRIVGTGESQAGQPASQNGQTEDRRIKLLKWKAEKDLQKKMQQRLKQPVFRAGIYHHKLNSPIFLHQGIASRPPKPPSPKITRATARRIAAKKKAAETEKGLKKTSSQSVKAPKKEKITPNRTIAETSFAPPNHQFKAPKGLTEMQLFGRDALDEVKTEPGTVPIYFSPYVVSVRGKRASRKQQLQNFELAESLSKQTNPEETNVHFVDELNNDGGLTTSHFRTITNKEVTRLTTLCQQWEILKTEEDIPEDAELIINQTIGQTNLLITKKIKQFKQLIVECETGCGEKLVTCQDLQGFWDMVYMQVEDCNSRFDKLTQLQNRDWKEEELVVKKVVAVKNPTAAKKIIPPTMNSVRNILRAAHRKQMASQKSKNENAAIAGASSTATVEESSPATEKVIPSKSSSIRDMIRAARRKQMALQKPENESVAIADASSSETVAESSRVSSIKFNGGFFMVESPRKTVTPRIVNKSTPSQEPAVLASTKSRRSALHQIRLSQILKPKTNPVEIESDPTIPYINSRQTPGKSILKRTDIPEVTSGIKKSHNKVNFSVSKETPESNINISWLGQSLMKTETCDLKLNAKKKLALSDSDSEIENEAPDHRHENESEISFNLRLDPSPERVSINDQNVQDNVSEILKTQESKLVNSSAVSPLTKDSANVTQPVRRTRRGVLNELNAEILSENSNVREEKSKTSPTTEYCTTSEDQEENEKPTSLEFLKRRRSSRKSVRFTGEDCMACSDLKTVYPMTPRTKRRTSKQRRPQTAEENSTPNTKTATPSQGSADLISWETPGDVPQRVRRSLRLQKAKQ